MPSHKGNSGVKTLLRNIVEGQHEDLYLISFFYYGPANCTAQSLPSCLHLWTWTQYTSISSLSKEPRDLRFKVARFYPFHTWLKVLVWWIKQNHIICKQQQMITLFILESANLPLSFSDNNTAQISETQNCLQSGYRNFLKQTTTAFAFTQPSKRPGLSQGKVLTEQHKIISPSHSKLQAA